MTNASLPASRERAIPCVLMRGGTSKAAYFRAESLPTDTAERDRWLLAAMGHGEARQIDGLGGGNPLTTKVAIVSASADPRADVDYLFAQVVATESRIDTAPTCGNILAGVGPFAIEQGLVAATSPETSVRIRMVNTASYCTAIVNTPDGRVTYAGDTHISGVPGTAAPVLLRFSDIAGSSCGALLPTGRPHDVIEGVPVTCIDNGMPVLLIRADSLGVTGYETPAALDANSELKARLEAIRVIAGPMMGLGDVRAKVVPKVTLLAAPLDGGAVHTRTFIPRVCHEAIGVLGAVSVATACLLEGSVAAGFVAPSPARVHDLSIEHPSGEFTVRLELDEGRGEVVSAALLRTARALFRGEVLIQTEETAS
jgi:4-oxalomesaconate tautomerase